jgi:hypothetical protein
VIDGPHEHFYYTPVHPADAEAVGLHGTLVKVFLKEDAQKAIYNDDEDVAFYEHSASALTHDTPFSKQAKRWESHLYHKIAMFVAQPVPGINVTVQLANNRKVPVLRSTIPFNYRSLGIDGSKIKILDEARRKFRLEEKNYTYLDVIDAVVSKEVTVEHEGTAFSCIVTLPRRGFVPSDCRAFGEVRSLSKDSGVLVDGISVGKAEIQYRFERSDSLSRVGVINFSGRTRPVLSVNRMSVIEWPSNIEEIATELTSRLTSRLIQEVEEHATSEQLAADSDELALTWEYLFSRFGFLAGDLINAIVARAELTCRTESCLKSWGARLQSRRLLEHLV